MGTVKVIGEYVTAIEISAGDVIENPVTRASEVVTKTELMMGDMVHIHYRFDYLLRGAGERVFRFAR